jgi:hypothetical protein
MSGSDGFVPPVPIGTALSRAASSSRPTWLSSSGEPSSPAPLVPALSSNASPSIATASTSTPTLGATPTPSSATIRPQARSPGAASALTLDGRRSRRGDHAAVDRQVHEAGDVRHWRVEHPQAHHRVGARQAAAHARHGRQDRPIPHREGRGAEPRSSASDSGPSRPTAAARNRSPQRPRSSSAGSRRVAFRSRRHPRDAAPRGSVYYPFTTRPRKGPRTVDSTRNRWKAIPRT